MLSLSKRRGNALKHLLVFLRVGGMGLLDGAYVALEVSAGMFPGSESFDQEAGRLGGRFVSEERQILSGADSRMRERVGITGALTVAGSSSRTASWLAKVLLIVPERRGNSLMLPLILIGDVDYWRGGSSRSAGFRGGLARVLQCGTVTNHGCPRWLSAG